MVIKTAFIIFFLQNFFFFSCPYATLWVITDLSNSTYKNIKYNFKQNTLIYSRNVLSLLYVDTVNQVEYSTVELIVWEEKKMGKTKWVPGVW